MNPWLKIEKPSVDLNVRLVDRLHPLKFFWGVDAHARYLLVYDCSTVELPSRRELPRLAGVDIYVVAQGSRGKLLLVVQDNANWEIFHALCSDLIHATGAVHDEATAAAIILRRLQRWQELLKRPRATILTPEEIKGLMGELLFLEGPLIKAFGCDAAIEAWKGPESSPQDFAIGETAVEVKCQSGGSKPVVRITSVDQLNPQLPSGYLVVYTLAGDTDDVSEGLSLNVLVARIRHLLSGASIGSRERLDDLLYMAGYLHREEYDDHRFSVVSVKSYHLRPGFPRIVGTDLIAGVEFVSYSIRLEACASFQSRPPWWRPD